MIRKALLVDDDLIILDILEMILERNGYDISRATDGNQAIKVMDTEDFDLVITDLQMGQTSGFDVIRKAKKANHTTVVIMITGCYDKTNEANAFHYGADDFLAKPFSMGNLLDRIQLQELKIFHPTTSTRDQKTEKMSG